MNAPGAAQSRIFGELAHGSMYSLHDKACGRGIIPGNVVSFVVKIVKCFAQPFNLH
jgi:hypothetical protein